MKAIMVMFDSLNRRFLPPYGCDSTVAPNFARLARRAVTFDNSYVCSMPCMPARRELHTARPNFLHRSWGPLEPFDDSMPEMLKKAGVYTHMVTDHYHYWEDGGATYHNRYSTSELVRGQEGDLWRGQVGDPVIPSNAVGRQSRLDPYVRQDLVNREAMPRECDRPQPHTFASGLDFIRRNASEDNWFLQIETFDPHEPFYSDRRYKDLYDYDHDAWFFDWPAYRPVSETPDQVRHCRMEYAALVSQCDAYLGDVLDAMDRHDMWKDTMLIVWTDHGFMLGEHDCWAKIWMPFYQEIAHTPFFVWDPRTPACGVHRKALVQPSLDIAPTLLDYFGLQPTSDMLGKGLLPVIASDAAVREAALFGLHGAQVNVTDGRYVYMRGPATPENAPLYNYTLMPTAMRGFLGGLQEADMAGPFSFTKGMPVNRIPARSWVPQEGAIRETLLWDVENDPLQSTPAPDAAVERRMTDLMVGLMRECDAPPEQFERLGLPT
ncbi:MAG: sulfatase [Armatimonadetes bacterium]|nr:sulfatase [Armatimonadota bacterium]